MTQKMQQKDGAGHAFYIFGELLFKFDAEIYQTFKETALNQAFIINNAFLSLHALSNNLYVW